MVALRNRIREGKGMAERMPAETTSSRTEESAQPEPVGASSMDNG
jgi:hypothetical protein